MPRRKLTLKLDAAVIDKAKEMGINISGFLETKLIEHIYKKSSFGKSVLPSGFEPESTAREA